MKAQQMAEQERSPGWKTSWLVVMLAGAVCGLAAGGCTTPLFRAQSPDAETDIGPFEESNLPFVGDLTFTTGLEYIQVESVGLVNRLDSTGGSPQPSQELNLLKSEMQTHGVGHIEDILQSPQTAMVIVRGYLPPGVRKGEAFDVEVQVPRRSETTSLKGGWLLPSRMREYRVLKNALRTGHVTANAKGPVLIDSLFDKSTGKAGEVRGRILGGAISSIDRNLGLQVQGEYSSVKTCSLIGTAINGRFHTFERGSRTGVAKPRDDRSIELLMHPRYKHNLARYLAVIRQIPVGETESDQARRLMTLERKLLEPTSANLAALQLEAIGRPAIPILKRGLASSDPEVRFCAAEALAYLDEADAALALTEAARDNRAFRWRALAALSILDHLSAFDGLVELFDVSSAETRYGAFRALRIRNPHDPTVAGELLADEFGYHEIATKGEPMVHFSRVRRQEVVLFGRDVELTPPKFLYAGSRVLLTATGDQRIKVSRFSSDTEDRVQICSRRLGDVIHAIVQVGGSYQDVLECAVTAKELGYLQARVEIDALPRPDREYTRSEEEPGSVGRAMGLRGAGAIPELFFDRLNLPARDADKEEIENMPVEEKIEKPKGIFGRMSSWFKR